MVGATALSLEGLVAVDADVVRLRRGDLNALSELITRYQNRLYRYLLRIVRQPAEAEDLFQQTWLRVVEKIRSFDASRNFDAWLFTLARNLAIDHLRRIRPQSLDEPLANSWHSETVADRIPCKDHTPLDHALAAVNEPNGTAWLRPADWTALERFAPDAATRHQRRHKEKPRPVGRGWTNSVSVGVAPTRKVSG
jgi:RNA polymerase sigma factor (sigma-70 family)